MLQYNDISIMVKKELQATSYDMGRWSNSLSKIKVPSQKIKEPILVIGAYSWPVECKEFLNNLNNEIQRDIKKFSVVIDAEDLNTEVQVLSKFQLIADIKFCRTPIEGSRVSKHGDWTHLDYYVYYTY